MLRTSRFRLCDVPLRRYQMVSPCFHESSTSSVAPSANMIRLPIGSPFCDVESDAGGAGGLECFECPVAVTLRCASRRLPDPQRRIIAMQGTSDEQYLLDINLYRHERWSQAPGKNQNRGPCQNNVPRPRR